MSSDSTSAVDQKNAGARRQGGGHMLVGSLAYLYAPLLPLLKRIKITRSGPRGHNPDDILLPDGYVAETVVTGLNAPVHCTFDDHGYCYVSEAGHKIDSKPRIVKVDVETGASETFFELPEERWIKFGAFTGACWHEGSLYFMNTDTLSRIRPDGSIVDVVTGLAGRGDHQSNYPVSGPDGKLYFGQGTATNAGVVGPDNFATEWLQHYPDFHDVPAKDVVLAGRNYEVQDVLGDVTDTILTGAYVPFGTQTHPGQVIEGKTKCTGAILRCNPDGSELEVVAWGLRNPYGTGFHPDGRLFAVEHGSDERGLRWISGDLDDFYEIEEGAWYGWPDFASGIRLDDPYWGDGGRRREPVLREHPDPNPPRPRASFAPHAAANGFAFCRDPRFGFEGQAFVALYGDLVPITSHHTTTPMGFKVVRVDPDSGEVVDFAVNKIAGPASKLPHEGFERPSHCAFGPDGALYVVDWGEIEIAPEKGAIRMQKQTGTLWRIRRTAGPRGDRPPEPVVVPSTGCRRLHSPPGLWAPSRSAYGHSHDGRERSNMKKSVAILLIGALLLTACDVPFVGRRFRGTGWGPGAFDSNGERIYFTATNEEGDRIPYRGGPDFGGMMRGTYLTCASCHGPDARGGEHAMHMWVMDAPDIRWSALAGHAEEGREEEGGEDEEHAEYDLETFRMAVVEGRHPDGDPLDEAMPRWQMSDDDLADLAEYLKSLP